MNLEVKHFKNELSDYYYLKSKVSKIEDMLLELEVRRGVSAVKYDKEAVQGSGDPVTKEINKLNDIEKKEFLDKQLIIYKGRLEYITTFIKNCDIGYSVMRIHCLGTSTYDVEAKKLHYSVIQLKRRVNKEIFKYIKDDTQYTYN